MDPARVQKLLAYCDAIIEQHVLPETDTEKLTRLIEDAVVGSPSLLANARMRLDMTAVDNIPMKAPFFAPADDSVEEWSASLCCAYKRVTLDGETRLIVEYKLSSGA